MRRIRQYELRWERTDSDGDVCAKAARFLGLKGVRRRVGLMTSDEPWKFIESHRVGQFHPSPSDYACCDGNECGCGGITVEERSRNIRDGLPPITKIELRSRMIEYGDWRSEELPEAPK